VPWPQERASGRPKEDEDVPLSTRRRFRAEHSLLANPALACEQLVGRLAARAAAAPAAATAAARAPSDGAAPPPLVARRSSLQEGLSIWSSALLSGTWKQSALQARACPCLLGSSYDLRVRSLHLASQSAREDDPTDGFCHPATLMRALSARVRPTDVICVVRRPWALELGPAAPP
jgi:hypothetical protein